MRTWKPIPNTDKLYWVSDDGLVQSRRYNKQRIMKPRIVKRRPKDKGHLRVTITQGGVRVRKLVHRLVGDVFIENPHNYPQINHKDGDKHNNHYKNLEWSTQSYNMWHSNNILGNKPTGNTKAKGENNPSAKLTQEQVDQIREKYQKQEYSQKELAKQYNVNRITIHNIVNYKRWKN